MASRDITLNDPESLEPIIFTGNVVHEQTGRETRTRERPEYTITIHGTIQGQSLKTGDPRGEWGRLGSGGWGKEGRAHGRCSGGLREGGQGRCT